jgi:Fe-S-cluster containining protein
MAIEHLVRRAMQTTYSMISRGVLDQHNVSVDLSALIDLLIAKGVVGFHEMNERRAVAEQRIAKVRAETWNGPQLTPENDAAPVTLDCESRQPTCKSACCRMYRVNLTAGEVKSGKLLWDLAVPYALPRLPSGDCAYLNATSLQCTIWDSRPQVCRQYSCEKDPDVWSDFAGFVPTDRVKEMTRAAKEPRDVQSNPDEERR